MFNVAVDIDRIVEEGNSEKMEKLSNILEDVIEDMWEYSEDLYKKYALCIYKMANGYVLTKDMAEDIIAEMKPEGEHWTLEQTTRVKDQYGFNASDIDFWVVMNMAYNDYRDLFKDNVEMYAKFSNAFINDPDAKEGKVFKYFT